MQAGKKKKAANGAGSIRKVTKVKNGKTYTYYEGRITTGIGADGRQKQRYVSGKTQVEVRKAMTEISRQVDNGLYIDPDKTTLGEWIKTWLNLYTTGIAESTRYEYEDSLNRYVVPELGKAKLQGLQKVHVQLWVNGLTKRLSPKTVRDVSGLLHHVLEDAVDAEILSRNPAYKVKRPKVSKPELDLPEIEEITNLLNVIVGNRFANAIELSLYTGMREGEILGLSWGQIDYKRGVIHVNRQLTYNRGNTRERFIKTPKRDEIRDVPLTPAAIDLLKDQKQAIDAMRDGAGDQWIERGLVFPAPNGDFASRQTLYCNFKKLADQAGIPKLRFHDLRHAYAMLALTSGVDVSTVQRTLGHATPDFTLRVYAYVTDSARREAAVKMQGIFERLRA